MIEVVQLVVAAVPALVLLVSLPLWLVRCEAEKMYRWAFAQALASQCASTGVLVPVALDSWLKREAAQLLERQGRGSFWHDGVFRVEVDLNPFRSAGAAIRL